ncbi:MAG TPA: dihydrodipicolinate synthase family protein [Pseudonocardia sp.]
MDAVLSRTLSRPLSQALLDGTVIPAHPLALTAGRRLDEGRQRALTRYYLDAGAGGLAVGVHTTQFAIHDPSVGLYEPVLALAAEELDRAGGSADRAGGSAERAGASVLRVAGVLGPTERAVREAQTAAGLGYHLALVAASSWGDAPEAQILAGLAAVGEVLPIFGFYLQPAVGGRPFGYPFWRRLFELASVRAVKVAPFDRYRTLDVVRALADSGRAGEVALYTGNDDSIVTDLITPFDRGVRIVGGLLGQYAVWTSAAVELHRRIRAVSADPGADIPPILLTIGAQLTEANAAIFDAAHGFRGCIPGIHEVLCREGVLAGRWCLDPAEELSPGQRAEIDRVWDAYPHLRDPGELRRLFAEHGVADARASQPHQ